jgi:hypothetical protein
MLSERVFMTQVCRFSLFDNAVCGSAQGGLYLFRFSSLVIERLRVPSYVHESCTKLEMAATRCFNAHTSPINSLE